MDFRVEVFSRRARRAAGVVAVSLALLAAATVAATRPPAKPALPAAAGTPKASPNVIHREAQFAFESAAKGFALARLYAAEAEVLSASLYSTTDAGRTWKRLALPGPGLSRPGNLALALDGSLTVAMLTPAKRLSYWLSKDSGAHWREVTLPDRDMASAYPALQMLDSRTGALFTQNFDGSLMSIDWTYDGGGTWERTLQLDWDRPPAG